MYIKDAARCEALISPNNALPGQETERPELSRVAGRVFLKKICDINFCFDNQSRNASQDLFVSYLFPIRNWLSLVKFGQSVAIEKISDGTNCAL